MPYSTKLLPNLYALAVFESAARWCNFTRAAAELGITQPSVSRHVLQLEHRLGVQLFDRRHNVLYLTPTGERMYKAVSLGYGHLRSELQAVLRGTAERPLALACTPALFTHWLMPRFSRLREALDGQEIRVTLSEWFDELDPDEVDVVVRWGASTWPDRVFEPVFVEEAYPVCSRAFMEHHVGDGDPEADPGLLSGLPLLHQYDGDSGFLNWEAWFAAQGVSYSRPESAILFSNFQLLLQAVREGQGVSLSWTYLTNDLLERGELVRAGPSVRHEEVPYGLDMSPVALPQWKRDRMTDWFRREAPATSGIAA
jgi:DNA-binding transcriptional LysR family regulator